MSPRARSRRCAWRSTTSPARSARRWPRRPRCWRPVAGWVSSRFIRAKIALLSRRSELLRRRGSPSSSRRPHSPRTTRGGRTPAPGARSCAGWSGSHDEGPATSPRTRPTCAPLARRDPRHLGVARGRRPHCRRGTNRTGPSGVPARRAPERARARPGADPPARDRGGHTPVAGPPRGARTADWPRRTRTGSDPAGERIRDRRDGPGGGPQSRRVSRRAEASGPVKDAAVRTRVLVLAAILALAFGGLTGRLAWLMIVKHGELSQLAERQYSRTVVLRAQRGAIVDRRGAALATSTATESLFAQPRSVGDPVRVAKRLAPVIGLSEPEVHAALTSARPFVWLRRN